MPRNNRPYIESQILSDLIDCLAKTALNKEAKKKTNVADDIKRKLWGTEPDKKRGLSSYNERGEHQKIIDDHRENGATILSAAKSVEGQKGSKLVCSNTARHQRNIRSIERGPFGEFFMEGKMPLNVSQDNMDQALRDLSDEAEKEAIKALRDWIKKYRKEIEQAMNS